MRCKNARHSSCDCGSRRVAPTTRRRMGSGGRRGLRLAIACTAVVWVATLCAVDANACGDVPALCRVKSNLDFGVSVTQVGTLLDANLSASVSAAQDQWVSTWPTAAGSLDTGDIFISLKLLSDTDQTCLDAGTVPGCVDLTEVSGDVFRGAVIELLSDLNVQLVTDLGVVAWETSGSDVNRLNMTGVIAHELGHALGYGWSSGSCITNLHPSLLTTMATSTYWKDNNSDPNDETADWDVGRQVLGCHETSWLDSYLDRFAEDVSIGDPRDNRGTPEERVVPHIATTILRTGVKIVAKGIRADELLSKEVVCSIRRSGWFLWSV